MANWFQRVAAQIEHEYERRIRRASLVTEYGPHHEGEADDGEVEIVNLPRGAVVRVYEAEAPSTSGVAEHTNNQHTS